MARYSSFGALDDQLIDDADLGFVTWNNRLRPDQLKAGQLADSQNGRMGINGEWQTRKGIDLIKAPFVAGGSALTLPFTLPTSGQINDGTTAYLNDTVVNQVYGSCVFSNPSATAEAYIILAANTKAVAVRLSDPTAAPIDITYPAAETISANVHLLQAFNKVFIFRDGDTAFEWDSNADPISGSPNFTLVANGSYASTAYLDDNNNTVIADGIVTVTKTAHGFSVGDTIFVVDKGSSTLVVQEDGYRIATVPNANTFTFYADVPDLVSHKVVYSQKLPSDIGFSHMPAPPWAVYHQRRLWMPFYYTQATVAGITQYTSRGIRDELIVSDVLDSDTYDQVYNQYRFNAGTADYVVTLHPFADDKLVVFNRNSIHLVVSAPDITQSATQLITNEVGCLARKSVIQVADNVIFLSDNGIYGTNFQDLYNLRGNGIPMSTSIQATIDRINKDYAYNAVAAYFDNRYYIAVPLDGSETNNTLLVYNFLNQGWESLDTVDNINWQISDLYVGGNGSKRGLYCVNTNGGIHRLEHREDGRDVVVTQIGGSTLNLYSESICTTRMFTYGITDRKRYNNFELQIESSPDLQTDALITAEGENIDGKFSLGTVSDKLGAPLEAGGDASIRGRLGLNRSYGLQFTIAPTQGRPRVRTIRVSASITNRAITSIK